MASDIPALAVFQDKNIRRVWHENEWWFSTEDIILALTASKDAKEYIKKMRQRDEELSKGWGQIVHTLSIPTAGGPQKMNCVNTEGAFRIVQSVTSPKAEPFKLWLAKIGYERVQEIQNPELAQLRMRELYKRKGYSEEWIEQRIKGIDVRDELTNEWKTRGVREGREFGMLTAEITKATFGMTPAQYQEFKGLKKENLRDHMSRLELVFSTLGEEVAKEITITEDAQGYTKAESAAKRGGTIAGDARKATEKEIKRPVTTNENYLTEPEKRKRLRKK